MITVENGGKLCIVNLQRTEKDNAAEVRVFDYCDHFIGEVIKALSLCVPQHDPALDFVISKKSLTFSPPFFNLSQIKTEVKTKKRQKVKSDDTTEENTKKRKIEATEFKREQAEPICAQHSNSV